MAEYRVLDHDIDDSLEYLEKIFGWSTESHSASNIKEPVLIGGWAVDGYNSWFGSLDIDLITNSRTESSLKHFLKNKEGFITEEVDPGQKRICKVTGKNSRIVVDFIGKRIPFVGKARYLLDSRKHLSTTTHVRLRNKVRVNVPLITELWIYKLKAAWDRSYRLDNGTSYDIEWETGKLSKDYNDIIALADAKDPLDPTIIRSCFVEFPFLREIIKRLSKNPSLYGSYLKSSNTNASEIRENLSIIETLE